MRQILFSITRPKFSNCLTTDSALSSGEVPTIAALAKTEGVSASYISLKISLAFLAPDILETIIDGMQPMSLTAGAAQDGLPPARFLGRAARLPAGLGKVRHREFAAASGEMTADQFTAFLETAFRNLVANSTDGSIHMVFMDWRHMAEVQAAGGSVYSELKNLIVWVKDNGGMGSFYRSRHELIFVFKNGTAPHVNSFELGQHGRYRTNVWTYKGMNSFGGKRNDELGLHPTVKPVALLADAIKDVSTRGSIVLDLFGGSGSTLIAAHKTGRRGYLMELDPLYCDCSLRRWENFAKDDAILEETGQTFAEVMKERQGPSAEKPSTE